MFSVTPTHLPVLSLEAGHTPSWSKYNTGCQKLNCKNAEMSFVTPVLTVIGIWFLMVGSAHTLWTSAKYLIAKNQQLSGAPVRSKSVWECSLRYLTALSSTGFCCGWYGSVNWSLINRSLCILKTSSLCSSSSLSLLSADGQPYSLIKSLYTSGKLF